MLEINSGCSSKILHVAMKFSGEITPEWTQNTHSNINMSFSCQHKIMRFNDRIESQVLRQKLLYTTFFQQFDNKGNPLKKHFIQTLDK